MDFSLHWEGLNRSSFNVPPTRFEHCSQTTLSTVPQTIPNCIENSWCSWLEENDGIDSIADLNSTQSLDGSRLNSHSIRTGFRAARESVCVCVLGRMSVGGLPCCWPSDDGLLFSWVLNTLQSSITERNYRALSWSLNVWIQILFAIGAVMWRSIAVHL